MTQAHAGDRQVSGAQTTAGAGVFRRLAVLQRRRRMVQANRAVNVGGDGTREDTVADGQTSSTTRVRITAESTDVRSAPTRVDTGNVVGQLTQGTEVEVLGQQGVWIRIQYRQEEAWIHRAHTAPLEAAPGNGEGQTEEAAPVNHVRVTSRTLNLRSSPNSATTANLIGQVTRDTQLEVISQRGDWLQVRHQGEMAWVHGGYTAPVEPAATADTANDQGGAGETGLGDDATLVDEQPTVETRETGGGETDQPGTGGGGADTDTDAEAATNPVLQLVNDFNNVPVWRPGELAPEAQPATTYQTPYLLNTVPQSSAVPGIRGLRIAQGRPHAGQTVGAAVGARPFIGKGTPQQMQIISQAVVDNAHDGQTVATIQAYANNGRMRTASRRNGKWGVDCSGLTSQLMHEMEGNDREGFESTNAASFLANGSRRFTNVSPENAQVGDIISFYSTNHVVAVATRTEVQLPLANNNTSRTQRAIQLSVGESTASQNAQDQRYVRNDRRMYYFPNATTVLGRSNPGGPRWRLASAFSNALPVHQPSLGTVPYSGSNDWNADYTLYCAPDPNGTNIRVRRDDGSFQSISQLVANGATGVELREVEGNMVRIRYNGTETIDGQTIWAPVAYVAQAGASYSVPTGGQPTNFSASLYSCVRNPSLPAAPADDGTTNGAEDTAQGG